MEYNLEIKLPLITIKSGEFVASDFNSWDSWNNTLDAIILKILAKWKQLWPYGRQHTTYTHLYQNGIWNLTLSYGKCLRFGEDYVKKYEDRNTIKSEEYYNLATKNLKYTFCKILWQVLGCSRLVICDTNFCLIHTFWGVKSRHGLRGYTDADM